MRKPDGIVAVLLVLLAAPARADDRPPGQPRTELRLGVGVPERFDATVFLFQHRLRVEAAILWLPLAHVWLEPSLAVRVLGPAHNALWLRGGYQFQHMRLECLDRTPEPIIDNAHAFDVGLAYRYRLPSILIAAEAGKEWLRRADHIGCGDSVIVPRSDGIRLALLSQWIFHPPFGFFIRLGIRTADHVHEIHMLPELYLGLSLDLP